MTSFRIDLPSPMMIWYASSGQVPTATIIILTAETDRRVMQERELGEPTDLISLRCRARSRTTQLRSRVQHSGARSSLLLNPLLPLKTLPSDSGHQGTTVVKRSRTEFVLKGAIESS